MDVAAAISYLARTMLRKLLTIFAFLTGLAALAAPAEARFASAEAVRIELAGVPAAQCPSAPASVSEFPAGAAAGAKGHGPYCPRPVYRVLIPTVQLGVDRAHE